MPVYEFWCDGCEEGFARERPMSECKAASDCPACGGAALRMLSVPWLRTSRGAAQRHAQALNERSRDQPRTARRGKAKASASRHRISVGQRPWMVGH